MSTSEQSSQDENVKVEERRKSGDRRVATRDRRGPDRVVTESKPRRKTDRRKT